MDAPLSPSTTLWRRSRRFIVVLGAAALFIGASSFIKPGPQGAHAGIERIAPASHDQHAPRPAQDQHPRGWKLLGILEGREHIVKCWATNDGPRYSVHSLDGRLIQDDLPADEVYRGFPDIELENLRADPPTSPAGSLSPRGTLVDFVDVWRE